MVNFMSYKTKMRATLEGLQFSFLVKMKKFIFRNTLKPVKKFSFWFTAALAVLGVSPAMANETVTGTITEYESYNKVSEKCVRISHIPGGNYSKADIRKESSLCGINFYSKEVALCPKVWSTSAAVVIYDIS